MNLDELAQYCKAQAMLNTIESSELSFWRSICREYSKKFHTPLHVVLDMDPEQVMLAEFEDQLSSFDDGEHLEELLDQIYTLEDPAYERSKRADVDGFIAQAEAEEERRVKEGRPIHKALAKDSVLAEASLPDTPIETAKSLPKSGGINLSYLSDSEDER